MSEIPLSLLLGYGLTDYTFEVLRWCREPQWWSKGVWLESGKRWTPATMRGLVEKGLLVGPDRLEKIGARPFSLSEAGVRLVERVGRGLWHWSWLSQAKVEALRALEGGPQTKRGLLLSQGVKGGTTAALAKVGYIRECKVAVAGVVEIPGWEMTELGREALREWEKHERDKGREGHEGGK